MYKFARISMAIIFIWFGTLKVLGLSPAEQLVLDLLRETMPFLPESGFLLGFGIFEVLVGIGFLIPKLTKFITIAFGIHMVTTFMPLVILPAATWHQLFVPTLIGQYIIKNVALISLTYIIYKQDHAIKSA